MTNPTPEEPCQDCGKTTACVGCWSLHMKELYPDNPKAWND